MPLRTHSIEASQPEILQTEILVVGGGVGGTAAAIQAARRGRQVILVSEFSWLGGMLTSAGVTAPDGNELLAWQTGLWGAWLQTLQQRQPGGLDHGWVSFFTYEPQVGAEIFADWVTALPNLTWIVGQRPKQVMRTGDRITGVMFETDQIQANLVLDGTELGDLLELGQVPHRWGWELQAEFDEPSAPVAPNLLTQTYAVQAPTWVVVMQDFGAIAPPIPAPPDYDPQRFAGAWDDYGAQACLDYGRLPGDRWMINWPIRGNDYGEAPERMIGTAAEQQAFAQAALWHSQAFAHHLQTQMHPHYGLAEGTFPQAQILSNGQPSTAFALHPYYRESRRLRGITCVREQDILPIPNGQVAALPMQVSGAGCETVESLCSAIAIGNYANDHHYPSGDIPLQPKSIRWGGRWTGTPFTIPYGALVPQQIDGLLACEKNISVTHMANGATRLQPLVMAIGQAAGMAAALCLEQGIEPRNLPVRSLQEALLHDPMAPAAVIPLFNVPPQHPEWLQWQRYYLDHPEAYSAQGYAPTPGIALPPSPKAQTLTGIFQAVGFQDYRLAIAPSTGPSPVATPDLATPDPAPPDLVEQHPGDRPDPSVQQKPLEFKLVTLDAEINKALQQINPGQTVQVIGLVNLAGNWVIVQAITM